MLMKKISVNTNLDKHIAAALILSVLAIAYIGPLSSAQTSGNSWVYTPYGRALASCVHEVPSNSTILSNGEVELPSGVVISFPLCPQQAQPQFPTNGWVEYAISYYNSITSFSGDWYVPGNPSSSQNQLVYLWNGLTGYSTYPILQSVLQWGTNGKFGGSYYTFASWYVTSSANYVYSTPLTVSANDWLNGQQTWYNNKWNIISQDVSANRLTVLYVSTALTETYSYATLEAFSLTACNQYPSTNTSFTSLQYQSGATPNWQPNILTNDGCGESVTIIGTSQVILGY